ncbi:hypothetical protein [Massilia soli]|uniref:Uncharacterized protein n=1 Tax=Massilia soli TaxID=2792854 RepID=A0ABS7SRE1_9BURK|nr:hypothetical protein [Massilia soli]MBZ2208524.1 hypothetical protein [Massilia soli]
MHELTQTQIAQRLDQRTEWRVAPGASPDVVALRDRIQRDCAISINDSVGLCQGGANAGLPSNPALAAWGRSDQIDETSIPGYAA